MSSAALIFKSKIYFSLRNNRFRELLVLKFFCFLPKRDCVYRDGERYETIAICYFVFIEMESDTKLLQFVFIRRSSKNKKLKQ